MLAQLEGIQCLRRPLQLLFHLGQLLLHELQAACRFGRAPIHDWRKYLYLSAVHRFYDEYYFRPKAVFRILKKAAFDSNDRKRLYKEAKTFLKLRSARNKLVKKHSDDAAAELVKA